MEAKDLIIAFAYFVCGLITFIANTCIESDDFLKLATWKKVLIRLSYFFFWPIWFISQALYILYIGLSELVKYVINALIK